ncbi:MAG: hydroxymethylpyrimidine/phosphomethylpyrimidine kinase [Candidatus Eremiobacteraeota bacterium]|nr:hydroxymethylpyrimidine/phosphomethylpyrimidine kinase [Candidatus Eremiobacteraeota bacterium]
MESALNKRAIVSIGSTHPWNIAGLGLDLLVAHERGLRSLSVVTGVTAQDEGGVHACFAVPALTVRAQMESLPLEIVRALRIGAIPNQENVFETARFIREHGDIQTVVDPVMEATLGGSLMPQNAVLAYKQQILSLPVILTPNIPEAARLLNRPIRDRDSMLAAAESLHEMGPRAVLLKGGHLEGDPCDVLVTETETRVFAAPRLSRQMRGTGCILAAALACELAMGTQLIPAVASARNYVRKKIEESIPFGSLHVAF